MTTQECADLEDNAFQQGDVITGCRYRDVREIFSQNSLETEDYYYLTVMDNYQFPPKPRQRQPSTGSIDRPPKSPLRHGGYPSSYVGRKSRSIICHESSLLPPAHFNAGRRPSAPTISPTQREQDAAVHYITSMSRSNSIDSECSSVPRTEEFDETLSSINASSVASTTHGSFHPRLNARRLAEVAASDDGKTAFREKLSLKNTDGSSSSQYVSCRYCIA